jgi:hypothetical protein
MNLPSRKRLFLGAVVVSLVVTAAIAIATLLFGDFGDTEGKILLTTALVSVYSLAALPAATLLDARRLLPLAWATLALAAAGFAVVQVLLWAEIDEQWLGQLSFTLSAYLVAGAQICALSSRLRPHDSGVVRALYAGGTVLALAAATMISVAIWAELESETYWRITGAVVVATLLLTALQPVLRRMQAPAGEEPAHRLRLTLAGGGEEEVELRARDFADAVARAVREAERGGAVVERIERSPRP